MRRLRVRVAGWLMAAILMVTAVAGMMTVTAAAADTERVSLGNDWYYDREARGFVCKLSSGQEIVASVLDGMVTAENVWIKMPSNLEAALYLNGKQLKNPNYSVIHTPGSYVLSVNVGGAAVQPLHFTVVGPVTGALMEYQVPNGFAVTELIRDGEDIPFSMQSVDLTEEGHYRITYYCQPTSVAYTLDIVVDHTPPVLALTAVENGVAKGPVDLTDVEQGATVYIEHDGKPMDYVDTLTESGSYVVTIQDAAGNSSTYKFMLQVYLNAGGMGFVALLVVLVVSVFVYLIYSKKHLRVR